jgi:short chain dehydrogenase
MPDRSTVLVVGASRGLGLALAEEYCGLNWRVIATARGPAKELEALASRYPGSLEIDTVDIVDAASVHALRERLADRALDLLFVNAGICLANEATPSTIDEKDFLAMMLTNALAPMRLIETFEDLVPAAGVIAVMTFELGSIAGNSGFWELYSSSKAALNMLMRCFAGRHAGDPRAMLLSRRAGSAPTWAAKAPRAARGCDIAVADLEAAGPLATALEGVEGAFVMLPPIFDPTPGFPEADAKIAVLREALGRSRPAKVVVLSIIGADVDRPNLLNQLGRLEKALADMRCPSRSCAQPGSLTMPRAMSPRLATKACV